MIDVFYSNSYISGNFDTTQKAGWVVDSLWEDQIPGIRIRTPGSWGWSTIGRVHHWDYLTAVRTGTPRALAESSGLKWSPKTPDSVKASTSGVVDAVLAALDTDQCAGSLSSGMHHARYDHGDGFCTINGLAVAAEVAVDEGARVLVLDLDAHCGGGTFSLLGDNPSVHLVDVSVCPFDYYVGTSLTLVDDADQYLPAVRRVLEQVEFTPDVVLYNAGMDPHEDSDIGGFPGITTDMLAARETMVFDWARSNGWPVAFALAGGYVGDAMSRQELVNLHRLTIAAAVAG